MRRGIIYKIENKVNGKIYIGQTINEKRRLNEHKRCHNKSYMLIDKAIFRYGWENFSYSVLFEIEGNDVSVITNELNKKEIHFIECFKSRTPNGYNILKGGSDVSGVNNPMYGKPISDLHRKRLVESHKGKPNKMKGRHYSAEKRTEMVSKRKSAMRQKYDNGYVVTRRKIVVLKSDGNNYVYVGTYPNAKEIERVFGIKFKRVHYVLKKGVPLDNQFIFIYEEDYNDLNIRNIIGKRSAMPICQKQVKQIDNTGNVIGTFSLTEATKMFGRHVSECCNGKRKTCKGYKFAWSQ